LGLNLSFYGVFQPYEKCKQQFSQYIEKKTKAQKGPNQPNIKSTRRGDFSYPQPLQNC